MADPPRTGRDSKDLFLEIQSELRRLAASAMQDERGEHTLQPTALLGELWLRLFAGQADVPDDKARFMALAAKVMRQVLVDHARTKNRLKRGEGRSAVTLGVAEDLLATTGAGPLGVDVVELDVALHELRLVSERQARVVELRFFAGLEVEEVAAALEISPRTVAREWRFAKAWLYQRMGGSA